MHDRHAGREFETVRKSFPSARTLKRKKDCLARLGFHCLPSLFSLTSHYVCDRSVMISSEAKNMLPFNQLQHLFNRQEEERVVPEKGGGDKGN